MTVGGMGFIPERLLMMMMMMMMMNVITIIVIPVIEDKERHSPISVCIWYRIGFVEDYRAIILMPFTSGLSHVQRLPGSGGTSEASLKLRPGMASLTAIPSLSRVSSRMLASWAPSFDAWARSWDSWNTTRPPKLTAKTNRQQQACRRDV